MCHCLACQKRTGSVFGQQARFPLDTITAKVLLINDAEDHANPPELGTVERAMQRVTHGRYVLLPAGPDTHGHFSHYYARLWKPYLIEFMATLGPEPTGSAAAAH